MPEFCDPELYDFKKDELCSMALVKLLRHGKLISSSGEEHTANLPSSGY